MVAGWATGTPHGIDGYARDFELQRRPHHALYRASTRENARNLPPGYIEDLGYSGSFAEQEIVCVFRERLSGRPGDSIGLTFEGPLHFFDAKTGAAIAGG